MSTAIVTYAVDGLESSRSFVMVSYEPAKGPTVTVALQETAGELDVVTINARQRLPTLVASNEEAPKPARDAEDVRVIYTLFAEFIQAAAAQLCRSSGPELSTVDQQPLGLPGQKRDERSVTLDQIGPKFDRVFVETVESARALIFAELMPEQRRFALHALLQRAIPQIMVLRTHQRRPAARR